MGKTKIHLDPSLKVLLSNKKMKIWFVLFAAFKLIHIIRCTSYKEQEAAEEDAFGAVFNTLVNHFQSAPNTHLKVAPSNLNESLEFQRLAGKPGTHGTPNKDGWILIQRPKGNQRAFETKQWGDYQKGFGRIGTDVFWLGLDMMHQLTSTGKWELLVRIVNSSKQKPKQTQLQWAIYKNFKVDNELLRYAIYFHSNPTREWNRGTSFNNFPNIINWPFQAPGMSHDAFNARNYHGGFWFPNHRPTQCPTCTNIHVESLMAIRKMPEK